MPADTKISEQGDAALRVSFTQGSANERWMRVRQLTVLLEKMQLPAITGIAPTYDSALIEFDDLRIESEVLQALLRYLATDLCPDATFGGEPRRFHIPVRYGGENGPDLSSVARLFQETSDEVIERHTADSLLIRCLGAPAASPLMDGINNDVAVPRRKDPRVRISAGSIAVAGKQSIIYSVSAPAGWQLLGRTPVVLVSTQDDDAVCAYRPGDFMSFFPISDAEWVTYEGMTMDNFRV